MSSVSNAAAQAAAFYRDVAAHQRLWTVRDGAGFPAPLDAGGRRVLPFWSTHSRVQRILKGVPAYRLHEPVELTWAEFRDRWLPELDRQGLYVGVNPSGARATGLALEPDAVRWRVEHALEARGGPPARPPRTPALPRGGLQGRAAAAR
ncbi:MAG TPA: DUF2750 domain-containing protein [Gemmatimonadales bacterium]|nr:DUF2750 domain-containing protein [Gemmatimonadales bacterium]